MMNEELVELFTVVANKGDVPVLLLNENNKISWVRVIKKYGILDVLSAVPTDFDDKRFWNCLSERTIFNIHVLPRATLAWDWNVVTNRASVGEMIEHSSLPWNWRSKTYSVCHWGMWWSPSGKQTRVGMKFISEHMDIDWKWAVVSRYMPRDAEMLELIQKFPEKTWNWLFISTGFARDAPELIFDNMHLSWDWDVLNKDALFASKDRRERYPNAPWKQVDT